MAVNRDKVDQWKSDIAKSVDMYNKWFMRFAPQAFRTTRAKTTVYVENALSITKNLTNIGVDVLRKHPQILPSLRMSTCPPLAVDRLIGLARVQPNLVKRMEESHAVPPKLSERDLEIELRKIGSIIEMMADPDIFVWLNREGRATRTEIHRAATIVADRLCGAVANPIIRNAQETRQLKVIAKWLELRGYEQIKTNTVGFDKMMPGTFGFRMNVPVKLGSDVTINIPIDVVVMPQSAVQGDYPIFFEAKSAGDFTNVNKRRKEEAAKMAQLRKTYGSKVSYNLFLCGYFDSGYLGYEAAEGIDWVWEHRLDDLSQFGL